MNFCTDTLTMGVVLPKLMSVILRLTVGITLKIFLPLPVMKLFENVKPVQMLLNTLFKQCKVKY